MEWLVPAALVFLLGSAIGSFLNVVIYRIPAGLSLLHPPSRCPHCLKRLKAYDNVPVFGWLWLRGRCRFCRQPIALRYPLVEFVTGLLFLGVYFQFGVSLYTLGYWALLSWLLSLALIDVDTFTLPNALTQSGLILGLGFQCALAMADATVSTAWVNGLMSGVVGAVLGLWIFDGVGALGSLMLGQTAMGGGDGKLAAMLGAWLGWQGMLVTGFLACTLGAFVGGGAIALGFLGRRQPMPFGPFLALAGGLTLFWGDRLVNAYLSVFFPLGGW
ncbi:MAG: prepilin peptidase [Cyanobacteria bacterium P01_A01_bin.123]